MTFQPHATITLTEQGRAELDAIADKAVALLRDTPDSIHKVRTVELTEIGSLASFGSKAQVKGSLILAVITCKKKEKLFGIERKHFLADQTFLSNLARSLDRAQAAKREA